MMTLKSVPQKKIFWILTFFILLLYLTTNHLKASSNNTVEIGYFPMNGFHEYDKTGNPIGYDVDYLNEISKYTHWNYSYVRLENTTEALKALENGTIDLIGGTQITKQRLDHLLYSSYPAGSTYRVLLSLSGNENLSYHDFQAMDNIKIGCVKDDIYRKTLVKYLKSLDISPEIVYYDSFVHMQNALYSGEISLIMADMMEQTEKEKLIAKFEPTSFYYLTNLNNTKLVKDLNEAMEKIQLETPNFSTELMQKWFPKNNLIPFTKQELAFAASYPLINIGIVSTRKPLNWADEKTGEILGMVPDVLNLIAKISGLHFQYNAIAPGNAPIPGLKEGKWNMTAGVSYSEQNQKDPKIILSTPFLKGRIGIYCRKGEPFYYSAPFKIALPAGFEASIQYASEHFPNAEIQTYIGSAACLNAIKNKTADVMLQNTYVISDLLNAPIYDGIELIPTIGMEEQLCIAFPANTEPQLISIINKSIANITEDEISQIVISHTTSSPYQPTLYDFLLEYKNTIIIIVILFLFIIGAIWYALLEHRKNNILILEKEQTLSNITNNINGGVVTILPDKGFTITYANNGFLNLIGYTREEYENESLNRCITYVHPDDIERLNHAISNATKSGSLEIEFRILQQRHGYIPVSFRATLTNEIGQNPLLYCVMMDISTHKQIIDDLELEKERYRILIEQSNNIIFEINEKENLIFFSPKFKEKFDLNAVTPLYSDQLFLDGQVYPEDEHILKIMVEKLRNGISNMNCRIRIKKIDNTYIWCDIVANTIHTNGTPTRIIGKIIDIDSQVRENERLMSLSQRDQLTGLYNKTAFCNYLQSFLNEFHFSNQNGAVFFIDLDHFKLLNDQQGHLKGDRALQDVSGILKDIFRDEDIIGRFGGDEFCVFVKNVPQSVLVKKAKMICKRLHLIYTTEDILTTISCSIGIYHFEESDLTLDLILERADEALYHVKAQGRNGYLFYSDQFEEIE